MNRVLLLCVVVSATAGLLQSGQPKPEFPLENDLVKVTVVPPSVSSDGERLALGINTSQIPLVQLRVPVKFINTSTGAIRSANPDKVSVTYVAPGGSYGGSRLYANHEAFFYIDLKSSPPKSDFRDDAVAVDPTHNEVLFDNEQIRVVRSRFEPGESGPMVDKRPRVIIARTDSQATVTFEDGHSEPREMKAGTVSFGNAGRQATKNTGTTRLENIVVELKSKDSEQK